MSRKLYVLGILALILTKLILVEDQPIVAYAYALHDDGHFVLQAQYMLAGHWLGPYNQYTLIKGPFLPIWIVATFLTGVPFLLSLQLLYALACLVTITALTPILGRRLYSLLLFAALLYNPFTYDTYVATRVTRDALYASLCLIIIASAAGLYLRRNEPNIKRLPWALGLGLAFSASALTREETAWLVPSLALCFACTWIGVSANTLKARLLQVRVWAVLPLAFVLSTGAVSALNYHYYSVFSVTEVAAPQFLAASSALQRVIPGTFEPMVPVTQKTRAQIYKVSSAFRELKPYLEGSVGSEWAEYRQPEMPAIPAGEIAGGWFLWALRDAVAAAGFYSQGAFPGQFYQSIADDINHACTSGELRCSSSPVSILPVWHMAYIWPSLEALYAGAKLTATFNTFTAHPADSVAYGPEELLFRGLTRTEVSSANTTKRVITGWAVNEYGTISETVSTDTEVLPSDTTIETNLPSPDVYDHFLGLGKVIPSAKSARFAITTSCGAECSLVLSSGDTILARHSFGDIAVGSNWSDQGMFVYIDQAYTGGVSYQETYNLIKVMLLERLWWLYHAVFPALYIIGPLGYLILALRGRRAFEEWVVLLIFACTYVARLAVLAIVSASSFYSVVALYLAPAYPLMIVFDVLAAIIFLSNLRGFRIQVPPGSPLT